MVPVIVPRKNVLLFLAAIHSDFSPCVNAIHCEWNIQMLSKAGTSYESGRVIDVKSFSLSTTPRVSHCKITEAHHPPSPFEACV